MKDSIKDLLDFLGNSPTPFHAVHNLVEKLEAAGFSPLNERDPWPALEGRHYVTRNDSSLIAFDLDRDPGEHGFRMVGAHTDSPCLRIKPRALASNNGYLKLGLEVYGGALLNPWFDRDLGIAGRVTLRTGAGEMVNRLLNINRPVAFIPSLAIHLDREVNEGRAVNRQKHLPALLCRVSDDQPDFDALLRGWLADAHPDSDVDRVLSFELSLYDTQPPAVVGLENEFIASARLDNLLSCHAAIEALLANSGGNALVVLNDHEEVGSASTSGAEGPFLQSVLSRICGSGETTERAIQHAMLVSADNAHGVHPNFADLHEPEHQPLINCGPVIKINNNQRYATNSETEGLFRAVCQQHDIPHQVVVVRSDMACGSTIGPITASRLGVRTIDIGVPQLGMHSIRELSGVEDHGLLVQALAGFMAWPEWPF